MKNAVMWFDIPVNDMARAKRFYETILGQELREMPGTNGTVVLFPVEPGGIGGDLACGEEQQPSSDGPTVYLDGGDDLKAVLDRVEDSGGKVVAPKTYFGEPLGYIAFFMDTEGNRLGLHSPR